MFCKTCGTENRDDALFCKKCGVSLKSGNGEKTRSESVIKPSVLKYIPVGRVSEFISENRKTTAVIAGVVLFIIVLSAGLSSPPFVNMNDYLLFSTEGYDGSATASVYVDWDSLENKYKDKIKLSGKGKKALKEEEVDIDEVNAIDYLMEAVYPEADKTSGLSNGTEIAYSWNIDEEMMEYVNCKVKYEDGTYTVEGLEQIEYPKIRVDKSIDTEGISSMENADIPDDDASENAGDTGKSGFSTYILPKSDRDLIEEEDLDKLSKEECSFARNEIYARHGRKFKNETIQGYFDSCTWYKGEIEPKDFDESSLNIFEKANRDLISKYEKEKGYR